MKYLVTGGTGLIGNALKKIIEDGAFENTNSNDWKFLSSKDYNLLDVNSVENMYKIEKPDYVIHLAAEVGGLFKNMNEKIKMFENNLLMNFNILHYGHIYNVQNIMCCLSTCIFPDNIKYPINESNLHEGPPHDSNYPYAYAKRFLDIHCRIYREQYQRNYFCIIPTNIYGPNDNFNLNDSHVIPALIHKCYLAKKNGEPFYIKGSGKPLRQFIYSIDIAKVILYLLDNKTNDSIILSTSEKDEISIRDISFIIAKCMNYDIIHFQNEYSDGQYKKTVSNEKLLSILPNNFSFTPIYQGIKETIEWFLKNYNNCRK